LTSAFSLPPCTFSRSFITAMASRLLSGSLLPSGSSPESCGASKVITRQPAEEKLLTVAWPIPREAPVG